jgi:hypothetical protein
MLPMSGLMLPMFFSPLQREQRQLSLAFSPFRQLPCGGLLANCGGPLVLLPNIFLTSKGLCFWRGYRSRRFAPAFCSYRRQLWENSRIHWYYLGKHSPRERIAKYPRLRSAGIWLVRRSNVEAWHVRSSCSRSPLGWDRGPRNLRPNLVSRHLQAMPFGWLHFAHFGSWPNYRCRKSRCILGGSR